LIGLKRHCAITLVSKGGRVHFVRRYDKKSAASHFLCTIHGTGERYQVVHGTQIIGKHQQPRAPDISLQRGDAPDDNPVGSDVLVIWDAKLRGRGELTTKRVSDAEFARFIFVKDSLGVAAPSSTITILPPAFEVSALVTNGLGPTEPFDVFFEKEVSVVERFQDAETRCAPTRAEHLARRPANPAVGALP
jgi:hypothetical protein